MAGTGGSRAGLSYPRLVPATLLPPEDPSVGGPVRRTVRDWFVDVLLFALSLGLGLVFYGESITHSADFVRDWVHVLDWSLGLIACVVIWWRRRFPIAVGVLTALLSIGSAWAAPASVVGMFSAAVHRRTTAALVVVIVNLVASLLFELLRPSDDLSLLWSMVLSVGVAALVAAWGMFVRARRQLVWTLRERAERAEAEQRMLAEQARRSERTRIAREMHDVLGHRISLMALHAGGLQVRSDLPAAQVHETAGLLRATAQQALEELRGVIGVLRDEPAGESVEEFTPSAPQPTLLDIPRLVNDTRRAGAKITFAMDVPDDAQPPDTLGRDAYRIVQEALTNVAKHATGTATSIRVDGAPGGELHVQVRNLLPAARTSTALPGSGTGLLGLKERVALAGGSLEHGPNASGEFVVDARLTWTG